MNMKKTYINPTMEVVKIQINQMLAASPGVETSDGLGNGYNSSDVTYSRDFDFDEDDEY